MPQSLPTPQLDLDMQPTAIDADSDSALRAAWRQLKLDKKLTFEQAMAHWGFKYCIRARALSNVRRMNQQARTGEPA